MTRASTTLPYLVRWRSCDSTEHHILLNLTLKDASQPHSRRDAVVEPAILEVLGIQPDTKLTLQTSSILFPLSLTYFACSTFHRAYTKKSGGSQPFVMSQRAPTELTDSPPHMSVTCLSVALFFPKQVKSTTNHQEVVSCKHKANWAAFSEG